MQKIAFTIFEVAKQGVIRNIPQEQLLQAVEHHVIKVYKKCIEDLEKKGVIDENTKENAESQSNIDAMAKQAAEEQIKQKEAPLEEADNKRKQAQREREAARKQRRLEKEMEASAGIITLRQMKLMSLAVVLRILSPDRVNVILSTSADEDKQLVAHYMKLANLESQIDGDILINSIKEIKKLIPVKNKLTQENVMGDMLKLYRITPRDRIEKVIKNERPLVKRFVSQAYDGEYSGLPLKVADIVAHYVEDSI